MSDYYTLITDQGRAAEVLAKAQGTALTLTHIAVGDGDGAEYNPTAAATELKNEVWRGAINNMYQHAENPGWLVLETYIPEDEGGWNIVEAAVFDEAGEIYLIAKYPATYKPVIQQGAGKGIWVRLVVEKTAHDNVLIVIDPSVVLATREYVDDGITAVSTALVNVQLEQLRQADRIKEITGEY